MDNFHAILLELKIFFSGLRASEIPFLMVKSLLLFHHLNLKLTMHDLCGGVQVRRLSISTCLSTGSQLSLFTSLLMITFVTFCVYNRVQHHWRHCLTVCALIPICTVHCKRTTKSNNKKGFPGVKLERVSDAARRRRLYIFWTVENTVAFRCSRITDYFIWTILNT